MYNSCEPHYNVLTLEQFCSGMLRDTIMAKLLNLQGVKTYATRKNAVKAVEESSWANVNGLEYFIMTGEDGRFFPVFVGERAVQAMVHFRFNVVA